MKYNDWDLAIMKNFPFAADMGDPRRLDEAKEYSYNHFKRADFTWKNGRFFFVNEKDAMLFILRWS